MLDASQDQCDDTQLPSSAVSLSTSKKRAVAASNNEPIMPIHARFYVLLLVLLHQCPHSTTASVKGSGAVGRSDLVGPSLLLQGACLADGFAPAETMTSSLLSTSQRFSQRHSETGSKLFSSLLQIVLLPVAPLKHLSTMSQCTICATCHICHVA